MKSFLMLPAWIILDGFFLLQGHKDTIRAIIWNLIRVSLWPVNLLLFSASYANYEYNTTVRRADNGWVGGVECANI